MMFFKNRCYNGGSKHNYKPRYEEKPYPGPVKATGLGRSLIYFDIYVHDICTWCGKTVEKK